MAYFKHELAVVESVSIGERTRIWAFSHVLPGATIGDDCNLCDHTFVENDVRIGNRVTLKSGVHLWNGITIEDDVFIGPSATFSNDAFPRSKQYPESFLRTLVKKGASIGTNATILPGIVIGESAMIGAGAVVTHDVPPNTIVTGNPARITGYVGTKKPGAPLAPPVFDKPVADTQVPGVTLHRLPLIEDVRGFLSFGEAGRHVPFEIKRYFVVFGVSSQEIRGEHAHKDLHQFFVCVHGACHVVVDDGAIRQEFILDSPATGIHVPPMIWAVQYKYSSDAVLLVLASGHYDATGYIRDYSEFLRLRGLR